MGTSPTDIERRDAARLVAAALAFEAAGGGCSVVSEPARLALDTLRDGDAEPVPAPGEQPAVCRHLGGAIATASRHGGPVADLAEAIGEVADRVGWVRRDEPEGADPAFANGHANAVLLRTTRGGHRALMGVSVMAPHVTYPDHRHPAEEVYLVLSPGEWRNDRVDWFEPGIGNVVHNPADIVHTMRSGDSPLLAVWLHVERGAAPERADG